MDSFSLIGFLPDKMLIWVQFGTRYFIDYIYLIIGIPLLVDFLIVWSPGLGLSFGSKNEGDSEVAESEANIINTVNFDEKFKFMYVYARNPNLFQSKESVGKFDDEISKMKQSYAPGAEVSGIGGASGKKGASSKAKAVPKKNVQYSFTDRLLKSGLLRWWYWSMRLDIFIIPQYLKHISNLVIEDMSCNLMHSKMLMQN